MTDKKNETHGTKNPEDKHEKQPAPLESKAKRADSVKTKRAASKEMASEKPKAEKKPTQTSRPPLAPKTYFPKDAELSSWRLVDATGYPLGRLSSHIAWLLMGKDKPAFTRFADTGDSVVVVNAEKVMLTGKKWKDKTYHYHTQYPGGIKSFTARELLEKHPERLIERAVFGMLPKHKGFMARRWFKKLRVFVGPEHKHLAQKPVPAKIPDLGWWERT